MTVSEFIEPVKSERGLDDWEISECPDDYEDTLDCGCCACCGCDDHCEDD